MERPPQIAGGNFRNAGPGNALPWNTSLSGGDRTLLPLIPKRTSTQRDTENFTRARFSLMKYEYGVHGCFNKAGKKRSIDPMAVHGVETDEFCAVLVTVGFTVCVGVGDGVGAGLRST